MTTIKENNKHHSNCLGSGLGTIGHFSSEQLLHDPETRKSLYISGNKHLERDANWEQNLTYRIYSINRPWRLLNFWTLRERAYSRLGAY